MFNVIENILKKAYTDIHKDVIELSKTGNGKAQSELYSLYSKAMYSICVRMLIVKEEAEDALQEAFTEVFDKLDSFRYESAFGAWIKRIVLNTCINKLKSRQKLLTYTDDIGTEYSVGNEPDIEETELTVMKIHKAIQLLPDGYRIIFCLYLLEGYDHKEISSILNISESTSKTQYMKARKKIKEILIEQK
ncbi:MAG: sigma-70 family RNA polymerase sigma factor [Bacteroidales bacterium]|nr:sigma-70 family RNA polymerase sigma factor [Bacteroidales bacterium]